ncbi:MAG: aspartate aminotransferase family protein [Actinobacteria bacterium]|nr:aspartate aminotransferase family protein [Actinomycetota bacterium]
MEVISISVEEERTVLEETALDARERLQESAKRHLWMNFSLLGDYADGRELPIMVRGEGCYVWDADGKRYLDGLSSLFCVNIGHGRADVGQAGAEQSAKLEYYPTWGAAHPPAIELAEKIASLAPGDLNRVFFTSGGGESVESALKLVRQFHKLNGKPDKTKVISRDIAYHGTTMGALTLTGIDSIRDPFAPMTPGSLRVPNTDTLRMSADEDPLWLAEAVREVIEREGADTVAAVIMEPVQTAGGCYTAPDGYFRRVREICDQHDVLLISDETICAWGRIGAWFGSGRLDYQPDIITTAKGLTSAYAPMGCLIASDRIAEPFLAEGNSFLHGFTFAGHPVCAAVAMANIGVFEREDLIGNVLRHEDAFGAMLDSMKEFPIVADARGLGYFRAIELVKDPDTLERFDEEETATICAFITQELFDSGLHHRADDRAGVTIQLAPPLIAGPEQFDEMAERIRPVIANVERRSWS